MGRISAIGSARFAQRFGRLKRSQHDIASLSSMLNASGTLGISHLAGMYPVPSSVAWSRETEKRLYDLSAITEASAKSGNVR